MIRASKKIRIDKALYEEICVVAAQRGYSSSEEMIQHVLQREVNVNSDMDKDLKADRLLRGLGYIE